MNGKQCTYTVENSKLPASTDSKEGKSGIGLRNVQRRLELSYPDQYRLKTEDKPDRYSIQLDITLS
jgi:sensor histidine kinase YesM